MLSDEQEYSALGQLFLLLWMLLECASVFRHPIIVVIFMIIVVESDSILICSPPSFEL